MNQSSEPLRDFYIWEVRLAQRINRQISAASAVMWTLMRALRGEGEAEPMIYWLIYAPAFTHGHKLWEVTKRARLALENVSSAGCLGSPLQMGWMRSSVIQLGLAAEPLLLIEGSQMSWLCIWLGCLLDAPLVSMSHQEEEPGHTGGNPSLSSSRISDEQEVTGERELWTSLLDKLPPRINRRE